MKTIKYFTAIILLSALTLGCNKIEHEKTEYTIEGRLMYNCDTPASNLEDISLSQSPDGINLGKKPLYLSFSTNVDGYFKITYFGNDTNGTRLSITKGGKIMDRIPPDKNLDLGDLIVGSRIISYVRRLEVSNIYSEEDTLIMPDYNAVNNPYALIRIPGPFENMIIDTVWNWNLLMSPVYNQTMNHRTDYYFSQTTDLKKVYIPIDDYCENINKLYEAVIKI